MARFNFLLLFALKLCVACKPNGKNGNFYCVTTIMNDYEYNSEALDDSKKQGLIYRGVAKAIQFDILNALTDSKGSPANKCQYYQRSHVQCFRQNYDKAVRVNILLETTLTEQQLAALLKELESKPHDSTYYRFTQSRITPGRTCMECSK